MQNIVPRVLKILFKSEAFYLKCQHRFVPDCFGSCTVLVTDPPPHLFYPWKRAHIVELLSKTRSVEQVDGPYCLRHIFDGKGYHKDEVKGCNEALLKAHLNVRARILRRRVISNEKVI